MNPIIIELDEITSNLTPGQLILLKIIYTSNKKAFQAFSKAYAPHIAAMLENLQEKLYIKLTGEEFEDYVCRDSAEVLFRKTRIEPEIDQVLNYLNKKLGKKRGFSLTSAGNRRFIAARLKEYPVEDLIKVINTMYSKWKGTNMEEYLRPETLFNETKFQTYLMMSENKEPIEMSVTTML